MKALTRCLLSLLIVPFSGLAQPVILWEAYNDYRPTVITHANVTGYDLRLVDDGGVLKNFATGADLTASVRVVVEPEGGVPDDFGAISARINAGSPADKLFAGKVDTGGPGADGLPGVRNSTGIKLTLVFENLDPTKRYKFRGTVARAGGYNDRWSFFGITGADSYVAAHEDGSNNKNVFTEATYPAGTLETNQVALNSGDNKVGSLIGWDNIEPGTDGSFSIEAQHYVGPAPFGTPSAGPYGYGLNALYLAELQATGNLRITENPANMNVPAGQTATLRVGASSPQTIAYQWQKAAAGSATFSDIAGATQSNYTTPILVATDNGSKYRVVMTSGGVSTTSPEATLSVDATVPTIAESRASINFNALHLTFSEAMNLEKLGDTNNYRLDSGLNVLSAIALDPFTVRLVTSMQNSGASYTATINNLSDIAGNAIVANTSVPFAGFSILSNTVGLELFANIAGSTVQNLRDSTNYPANPTADYVISSFDTFLSGAITNTDVNTYGGRMRAWITPEETADYEFFIRADDQGELRISTDDKFTNFDDVDFIANNLPTATDVSAGDTFQETGADESISQPVHLEKGKKYAMQVLWKEGNGGDYVQIAWRKAGDQTPADQLTPVPSRFLSYYAPTIVTAPGQPRFTRIAWSAGKVTIEWTGTTLQSTPDFKTWTDEPTARSPLQVTPVGNKFYRVKN